MRSPVAIVALLLLSATLTAQPSAPTPPKLTLTTAKNQTTFHLGERIPITFNFTGPDDGSFRIFLYRVNRVGGMPFDEFSVEPNEGAHDPLAQYLAYTGGGINGYINQPVLSSTPIVRAADLNEWIRFDQPGTYTVTALSRRVYRKGESRFFIFAGSEDAFRLRSEPLIVHVIAATPEWQKATLARALKVLDAPWRRDAETPDPRDAAFADLRYLGTPEAIAVLVARCREDELNLQWQAEEALVSLAPPQREIALADMRRMVDEPHFPVSSEFLNTMAWLQLEDLPLPDFDHFDEDKYRTLNAAFHGKQQPLLDAAWQSAALALPHKVEPARSATARALSESMPATPAGTAAAELGAILRKALPQLSNSEQIQALTDRWDLLRSRDLIPYLRNIALAKDDKPDNNFPGSSEDLRAIALERWYEFEPEAATRAITDLISVPSPRLSATHLAFLPADNVFPQLEPVWAKTLADDDEDDRGSTAGNLLVRFGTGQAVPRMLAVAARTEDSRYRNEAIAYLVRFAPDSARALLIPGSMGKDKCLRTPLAGIVQDLPDPTKQPVLIEAALQQLNSTCANDVQNAATFLMTYGDDSARKPLLEAYLRWSKRWSGVPETALQREDDDGRPEAFQAAMEEQADRYIGDALARALLVNLAWMPDAALTADVVDHCAGRNMCDQIGRLAKHDLRIDASLSKTWTYYDVDGFNCPTLALFEAKLDQFPAHTTFTLDSNSMQGSDEQRLFYQSLPTLLEKHGMHLASPSTP